MTLGNLKLLPWARAEAWPGPSVRRAHRHPRIIHGSGTKREEVSQPVPSAPRERRERPRRVGANAIVFRGLSPPSLPPSLRPPPFPSSAASKSDNKLPFAVIQGPILNLKYGGLRERPNQVVQQCCLLFGRSLWGQLKV